MRPVNLIPPEDRRGDRAPLRTGAFAYVLVGGLGLLLLAIVVTALTSKQISDRESEKATLEQELDEVTAKAQSLRAFSDFRTVQQQRTATISSLAQSRFDWERVMQELSRILPSDIWLINLTGTVSPEVSVKEGAEISVRDSVPGPALEIEGCAPSEDSLAAFIADLEDIDGVTRVGIAESKQKAADQESDPGAAAASTTGVTDCRTADFITQFELVVAFDAVPVPAAAAAVPGAPPAPPAAPAGEEPQLADAQAQQQSQVSSTREQTAKAEQAQNNLIPGG